MFKAKHFQMYSVFSKKGLHLKFSLFSHRISVISRKKVFIIRFAWINSKREEARAPSTPMPTALRISTRKGKLLLEAESEIF